MGDSAGLQMIMLLTPVKWIEFDTDIAKRPSAVILYNIQHVQHS